MKSAVLIIDVQNGLFDENPKPFESDVVIQRINHVTNQARNSATPVLFIQHEAPTAFLEYGSDSWQLPPALIVRHSDYKVRKSTPDSFLRTNLEEILTLNGVSNVIICGYATEFCVDTTTRRAAALGYSVQLVADAHTTHDKAHASAEQIRNHHNVTLPNITSFGPHISVIKASELHLGG